MSDTQTYLENRPPTVAVLFLERVAATPNDEAYRYPVPAAGGQGGADDWKSLSWGQAAERVFAIAAGLISSAWKRRSASRSPPTPGSTGSSPTSA